MARQHRKTPYGYYNDLHSILDTLFLEIDYRGWTQGYVSQKAKLCQTTISKHRQRKVKWPEFLTVWKLANSLGYKLDIVMQSKDQKTNRRGKSRHKYAIR